MKTLIIINIPNSLTCQEWIENIQNIIIEYFGKKYAESTGYNQVIVSDTVTKEDLEVLHKKISDKVFLTAIVGHDNSEKIDGNFIYLN